MDDLYSTDIVLENGLVKLVPFLKTHEIGLKKIIFDKEITRYTGNHIVSNEDLQKYITRTLTSRREEKSYPFTVIDKRTGEVAGCTRLGNINFQSKRLEIGWTWYGRPYRGTGVNKATKYELLRFAFEELRFNRVQFSVDAENIRSQKAVLKLGAKQEGIFRSNYINAAGEPRDDIYFSIICTEWPEIKKAIFSEFT